jgi:retron-type reverse transcriptase
LNRGTRNGFNEATQREREVPSKRYKSKSKTKVKLGLRAKKIKHMKQPIDKENCSKGSKQIKKEKLQLKQKAENFNQTRSQFLMAHTQRNLKTDHINFKVYHMLTRPWTFITAYSNIALNKGALTPGINPEESTTELFSVEKAIAIAREFKNKTYKHKPLRGASISKPGKKTRRPMDTATQKDRIVQEAVRGILEAIYEPEFKEFEKLNNYTCTNYGFRPQKGCFDAVNNYKSTSKGCKTIIEGGIIKAYNNVNHNKLIQILSHRIRDKKFLNVIRNLLEAGIMENHGKITHNLNGIPQGGIVSPLLFNIYMFEFDKYIYNKYIKYPCVFDTSIEQRTIDFNSCSEGSPKGAPGRFAYGGEEPTGTTPFGQRKDKQSGRTQAIKPSNFAKRPLIYNNPDPAGLRVRTRKALTLLINNQSGPWLREEKPTRRDNRKIKVNLSYNKINYQSQKIKQHLQKLKESKIDITSSISIEVKQEQYKKIKYLYKSLKRNSFGFGREAPPKTPCFSFGKTATSSSTEDTISPSGTRRPPELVGGEAIVTKQQLAYENYSTYIRYADDWIFSTRKNKHECKQIKAEMAQYLKNELFMELDITKTVVSILNEGISFLGWSIYKQSYDKKTTSGYVTIEPDTNKILNKLTTLRYCQKDGFPIAHAYFVDLPEYYIVQKFNEILRGLANYYSNCDRPYKLNRAHYILTYSCLKTIARRKKISLRQVIKNYGKSAKFTTILKYSNFKTGIPETKTKTIQLLSYEKFIKMTKPKTKKSAFKKPVVSKKQQRNQDDPFKILKRSYQKDKNL